MGFYKAKRFDVCPVLRTKITKSRNAQKWPRGTRKISDVGSHYDEDIWNIPAKGILDPPREKRLWKMNTEELNDKLDSLRERVRCIAERDPGLSTRKGFQELMANLEAATDAEVRNEIKVAILELGELRLREAALPEGSITALDLEILDRIRRDGLPFQ
jgi:hypothetical protein